MECPNCKKKLGLNVVICDYCGYDFLLKKVKKFRSMYSYSASRYSRLAAAILDSFIYAVPGVLVFLGILSFFKYDEDLCEIISFILCLPVLIYQAIILSKDGQTLGKKIMKIRIIKVDTGDNGGFKTNILIRLLLNSVFCIIPVYALVDILFIFREDNRCIHDLLAGTVVVET